MENYDLAKLVQWAVNLRTRKKMQKVVYLLQAAGCPFEAEYRLHHFGPYSSDVAETTDILTQLGMFHEERIGNMAGSQFNYTLTQRAQTSLDEFERSAEGQAAEQRLSPYRDQAVELIKKDVRLLEVAATIAYFWRRNNDWDAALEQACRFKSLKLEEPFTQRSLQLARQVLDR